MTKTNKKVNPDGSVTINLEFPINYSGKEYKEITLKRPKLKDAKGLSAYTDSVEGSIELISRLSGLPHLVIEELDSVDNAAIEEVFKEIQKKSQATVRN